MRQLVRQRCILSVAIVAAGASAGCSADFGRFDSPGFSLTDTTGSTSGTPRPTAPMRAGTTSLIEQTTYETAAAPNSSAAPRAVERVEMAALPEPSVDEDARRAPHERPAPRAAANTAPARGETITIRSGDTLYGLSRRHQVPISELMAANGITSPKTLRVGQALVLPAEGGDAVALQRSADVAPARVKTGGSRIAADREGWNGTYTVKSGDSPYAIAQRHKVSLAELQDVNGITDPRRMKPGAVLRVPGRDRGTKVASLQTSQDVARDAEEPVDKAQPATVPPPLSAASEPPPSPAAAVTPDMPRIVSTTTQPIILNAPSQRVAAVEPAQQSETASDAAPAGAIVPPIAVADPSTPAAPVASETAVAAVPATPPPAAAVPVASGAAKLRWPVKGKIVEGFGSRPDGTRNDGIDVAVPKGTPVHAAEAGKVYYAGNELAGYGNLVLVQHSDGMVTAYANNDELLVKKDETVTRGQVIAKAGNSGNSAQPQLHFELRKDSKPVDPTPFLEPM